MNESYIDITDAQYKEASPVIEAAAAIRIAQLEMQVKFLLDTFTKRDAEQRGLLEAYKEGLDRQNITITWLKAQYSKELDQ